MAGPVRKSEAKEVPLSENDWFDYRLEHDPRFLQRVEQARASFRVGRRVKIEDIK